MRAKFHNFILVSLVTLTGTTAVFIGWTGWLQINYPYDGFYWSSRNGTIETIFQNGPAYNLIEPDDKIIAVDNRLIPISTSLYTNKRPGDVVIFTIERKSYIQKVPIRLTQTPVEMRLIRLLSIMIAFGFLVIGIYVFSFQMHDVKSKLFLLVCLISSLSLASGSLSTTGPPIFNRLFGLSLCWLIPLIVSFHLVFPKPNYSFGPRLASGSLFAIATVVSVWQVLSDASIRSSDTFQVILFIFNRSWLAVGLIMVVYLLFRAHTHEISDISRQQAGIVTLGGSISALTFLSLMLLPDITLGKPVLPYEVAFGFLLLIPLSYAYAIVHYRLIPLESHVNRLISSSLTLVILLGLFFLLAILIVRILPIEAWSEPLTLLAFMAGIVTFGIPLKRKVQSLVDRLLYGPSLDLRTKIKRVSQLVHEPEGWENFRQLLIGELTRIFQLECACIYMHGAEEGFNAGGFSGNCLMRGSDKENIEHPSFSLQGIKALHMPVPVQVLRQDLVNNGNSYNKLSPLACEQAYLAVPLHGSSRLMGMIMTGSKIGRGEISKDEQDILQVIAWQAGIALENIQMASELKQRNLERIRLNHQILLAGESERKRLAWELHDQIIQSLTGIGYGLAELRHQLKGEGQVELNGLQENVFGVINDLRLICTDLRPPLLDTLGLAAAIRSLVRSFNRGSPYRVTLEINSQEERNVSEDIAICIYRSLQEILHNAEKYSSASLIHVNLILLEDRVSLKVDDNGKGFLIPKSLSQFSTQGHFGLMGIQERVEMLSGKMEIESAPGSGCRITIDTPINSKGMHASKIAPSNV